MIDKIDRKPDLTTANGLSRWINYNNYYGTKEKIVTNRFDKKHNMYQKYGITAMQLRKFDDGRECISIDGDIFEGTKKKNFSYTTSRPYFSLKKGISPYKNVEKFLKELYDVRKMNISDSMINVIKCIH